MKLQWIGLSGVIMGFALVSGSLLSVHGRNLGQDSVSTPFIALSSVSKPELPAKATELVQAASPADRNQTARDVLQAVFVIARPGVLPYALSAICRGNPEVAGSAVATAIELQPQKLLIFTRIALRAAPSEAEQIVFAACGDAPEFWANVALVASWELPGAKNSILAGVAAALPYLKSDLQNAEIQAGANNVEAVIKQAMQPTTDNSKPLAK